MITGRPLPLAPQDDDDPTDDGLVQAHRSGDRSAFESLVARHGPSLYGYLLARTASPVAADDLFQDVFVSVLGSLDSYRGPGRFRSWMFTIARHAVIDRHRTAAVRRERSLDAVGAEPPTRADDDPLASASAAEERRRLAEAVERLSPKLLETYLLRTSAGLTFREIAETLDAPLGTVLARMRYALDALRRDLATASAPELSR